MARHVLFLVHGMGSYSEPTWSDRVATTLRSVYKQFDRLSTKTFDERFEVVPLTYDDQFETLRSQWRQSSKDLRQVLDDSGTTVRLAKRVVAVADAGIDDSFFWTHVMDVVLYRLLGLKTPVEIAVAKQLIATLHQRQLPAWSVLAHSLGTAVTHGALYRAYTATKPLLARETKPALVMMVANVSRALQTAPRCTIRPCDLVSARRAIESVAGITPFGTSSIPLRGPNSSSLVFGPTNRPTGTDTTARSWSAMFVRRTSTHGDTTCRIHAYMCRCFEHSRPAITSAQRKSPRLVRSLTANRCQRS